MVVVAVEGTIVPIGIERFPTGPLGLTVPFTADHPCTFSPVAVTTFPEPST
jgi:hypothetical protein